MIDKIDIFLIRHALAEDREIFAKEGLDDSLRPLTGRGKKRMEELAYQVRKELKEIELLVSSPLLRARETALILAKFCKQARWAEALELSPEFSPEEFFTWLQLNAKGAHKIALVGHEPWLGMFANCLLGLSQSTPALRFKKSAIANFEMDSFEPGKAQLRWLIPPGVIA